MLVNKIYILHMSVLKYSHCQIQSACNRVQTKALELHLLKKDSFRFKKTSVSSEYLWRGWKAAIVSSLLKKQAATSKGETSTSMVWRMLRSTGLVAIIRLLQAMSWEAGNS